MHALKETVAMTYRGHVQDGVIVVDEPIDLPEGTAVEFHPIRTGGHHPDVARFAGVIAEDSGGEEEYYEYLRKNHQ
jgi:hypothetical protein